MYKVIEVAELLGVSKVTIYKKIENAKPGIIAHLRNQSGITYIDDYGVNLLKESIKRKKTRKPKNKEGLEIVDLKLKLKDFKSENKKYASQIEEINDKYIRDLIQIEKQLDTLLKNKIREMMAIKSSNDKLRQVIEKSNKLLLMLNKGK